MTTQQSTCTALLLLALLFKFWLIAEMEITDDPSDPSHYMEQIVLHEGLCYGPGMAYAGKFFYQMGIPYRLGIEVAFLFATALVMKALFDWPTRSYLALGLYLFVTFNPAVEELLSHLWSDPVWMMESLAAISFFVFFADTQGKIRWLYVTLAGLFWGFSTITRTTFVPLMMTFFVWAVLCGVLVMLKNKKRNVEFPVVGGCFLCLYAIVLFYYSTCFYNSERNGFFGISALDCREYQDFYLALQSVGEPTGERYYPVDANRLNLIAQAGPRSLWFVNQMEKDIYFRKKSMEIFGKDDFALSWFQWAVLETVDTDGDLNKMFALFRDVENEITLAGKEKRLKVHSILPLPDCRIPIVLSALPESFNRVVLLISREPSRYAWDWLPDEPKFDDPNFSLALDRRQVTPSPQRERIGVIFCKIYAWVYAPLLPILVLVTTTFVGALVYRWRAIPAFSFHFLAQHLFAVSFLIIFLWYLLFAASGVYDVPRYLIFQNVMLPILLVYYAWKTGQLLTEKAE